MYFIILGGESVPTYVLGPVLVDCTRVQPGLSVDGAVNQVQPVMMHFYNVRSMLQQCLNMSVVFECLAIRSNDCYVTFSKNGEQELPGCQRWEDQEKDPLFTVTV